jgi:two-component system, OmpR family, phosphate regulon sensor histidine kinase PhoR
MTSSTTTSGLEREYRRLVALNRSRDRFLHTVSHELRTPLTSILSCTEMLGDARTGVLSVDQRELLEIVERGAGRLMAMVDGLLELAGLESGRLLLARELLDLPDVVAQAADAQAGALADAGLDFRSDLAAGPPACVDGPRIRALVEELLRNAERHTPAGGRVTLSTRAGEDWAVAVSDTGTGIPLTEQRTVFDAFTRAGSVRDGTPGSGLGLTLGRTVAELHGGTLTLDSPPGAGTTVTLRLPFAYTARSSDA